MQQGATILVQLAESGTLGACKVGDLFLFDSIDTQCIRTASIELTSAKGSFVSQGMACAVARRPQLRCYATSGTEPMKAAAMIVGDEILSGNVTDTNTPWLAKLLFK